MRIVVPLIIVAIAIGGWRTLFVFDTAKDIFDRNLTAVSVVVSRDLASSGGELLSPETLLLLQEASGGIVFYHVFGPDGAYVAGFEYPLRADWLLLSVGVSPTLFNSSHLGKPVRAATLSQWVNSSGLEGFATITVWQDHSIRQQFAIRQAIISSAGIVALVVAVMAFVWFGVNSGLAPLTQLREAVARRSSDELRPIERAVPEEVRPLVGTLNGLFQEVQNSIDAWDRFIGNAAHQLCNPIAAVQARAKSAMNANSIDEMRRRVGKTLLEAQHTSQLAEQLLMLERLSHSPDDFVKKDLDVAENLLAVANRFGDRAMDRDVDFSFDTSGKDFRAKGNPDLFSEAIENLLDNALAHAGPTLKTITLTLERNDQIGRISVRDDGRGIPVQDRDIVFERFAQLDFGRGSGLRLAITKEIVLNHNGTIKATSGLNGAGVGFEIGIPLLP